MPYFKFMFITMFLMLNTHIFCKILSEDAYAEILKNKSNKELKQEYLGRRKSLTISPRKFPEGIEADITVTQTPIYKMAMFNAVIKEIVNRLEQAKTIEEISSLADLFFKKQ